ncbi:MAG: hypothetical protein ABI557_06765 [Aureliella sp.]
MAKRDSFLLRIDPLVLAELRRWADDDLRSLNGQIEYLLRQSLQQAGRPCSNQEPTVDKSDQRPKGQKNRD